MRPQGDAGSDSGRTRETDAPSDSQPLDPAVLEQVIAETLVTDSEPLKPQEQEALLVVARRWQGRAAELDRVAVELVDALLSVRLSAHRPWIPPVRWQNMCSDVAGSLCDSPAARDRLARYWDQLIAASSSGASHD